MRESDIQYPKSEMAPGSPLANQLATIPMIIRLRYSGRAYDLAEHLPAELRLNDGTDVASALAEIQGKLPEDKLLPPTCLIAVNGAHLGTIARHGKVDLRDGDEILLVAPVAGG